MQLPSHAKTDGRVNEQTEWLLTFSWKTRKGEENSLAAWFTEDGCIATSVLPAVSQRGGAFGGAVAALEDELRTREAARLSGCMEAMLG